MQIADRTAASSSAAGCSSGVIDDSDAAVELTCALGSWGELWQSVRRPFFGMPGGDHIAESKVLVRRTFIEVQRSDECIAADVYGDSSDDAVKRFRSSPADLARWSARGHSLSTDSELALAEDQWYDCNLSVPDSDMSDEEAMLSPASCLPKGLWDVRTPSHHDSDPHLVACELQQPVMAYHVRNTFVEVDSTGSRVEDDDTPTRVQSSPANLVLDSSDDCIQFESEEAQLSLLVTSPCNDADAQNCNVTHSSDDRPQADAKKLHPGYKTIVRNTFIEVASQHLDADAPIRICSSPPDVCDAACNSTSVDISVLKEDKAVMEDSITQTAAEFTRVADDIAQRQPEPSAGSARHSIGECKPCGWFWKKEGCIRGSECYFCHMCPATELKTRKRAKHVQNKLNGTSTYHSA